MDRPTTVQDGWLTLPQGRVYTRRWLPQGSEHDRAPIVLFHDSLGSVELWRAFPEALCHATGRPVIAYDRLGFGRSSPAPGPLPLSFIADEARTTVPLLRAHYGVDRFVAFGHSVGGGMAVECAAQWPDACVGVITEAAQAFVEAQTLHGIEAANAQFQEAAQLARLEKYHGAKARWVVEAWTGTWLDPAFASWSLAPVLPRVVCPLLVIHGSLDEYGSRRQAELLHARAGGVVHLHLLPGLHHVPHREATAQVLALVRDFTATLEA